jgi:hypothetical protein
MRSASDILAVWFGSPFTVLQWSVLCTWMVSVALLVAHRFRSQSDGVLRIALISSFAVGVVAVPLFAYPRFALAGGLLATSIFLGLVIGLSLTINERLITTPF